MFCYPEHIDAEMRKLFAQLRTDDFLRGRSAGDFARHAAHLLAELNAIHPFREGNGRTQLTYLTLLSARAGHPLALQHMNPDAMLAAMVASFRSDEAPLATLIERLIELK
jgi:cell filamentation protein